MGKTVESVSFVREDYRRYRRKVRQCLDVFAQMLDHFEFDEDKPMTGLEIEINLIDRQGEPAMRNAEVLALADDPNLQAELGLFNLELNVPPHMIAGDGFDQYERMVVASLEAADARARELEVALVLVGILPTVMPRHTVLDNISANPRYRILNEQIIDARGDDVSIDIRGVERLQVTTESILPEAANTSAQLHLQVTPATFATYWNASQAIAGVQVAVGANSPVSVRSAALGRDPGRAVRAGHRHPAGGAEEPGGTPAGLVRRALDHVDLRPLRGERPLLPRAAADLRCRGPGRGRRGRRRAPPGRAAAAQRHGLPVEPAGLRHRGEYGRPHLRVENRVLPAGPTVVDMLANAAFYFGLTRSLRRGRPTRVEPAALHRRRAELLPGLPRRALAANLYWPRGGEVRVTDLVLERLLPAAHEGLDRFGVDPAIRDRLLGVIERRCALGRNGSVWQSETVAALERRGPRPDRARCARCCCGTPSSCAPTSRCTRGRSASRRGPVGGLVLPDLDPRRRRHAGLARRRCVRRLGGVGAARPGRAP